MPTSTTSSTPSIVPSHPPPLPPTEPSYHPPGHSPQSSSSKSSLSGHRSGKAVSFVGESDDPRKASARDERGSTKSLADFLRYTGPDAPTVASSSLLDPSSSSSQSHVHHTSGLAFVGLSAGGKSSKRPSNSSSHNSLFSLGRRKSGPKEDKSTDENGRLSLRATDDTVKGAEKLIMPSGKHAIVVPYRPGHGSVDLDALFPNAPIYEDPTPPVPHHHPNLSALPSSPTISLSATMPSPKSPPTPSRGLGRRPATAPNEYGRDWANIVNTVVDIKTKLSADGQSTIDTGSSPRQRGVTQPSPGPLLASDSLAPEHGDRVSSYSAPPLNRHQSPQPIRHVVPVSSFDDKTLPATPTSSGLKRSFSSGSYPTRRPSIDRPELVATLPLSSSTTYTSHSPLHTSSQSPPTFAAGRIESVLDPELPAGLGPRSTPPAHGLVDLGPPIITSPQKRKQQVEDQILALEELGHKVARDVEGRPIVGRRVARRHVAIQAELEPPTKHPSVVTQSSTAAAGEKVKGDDDDEGSHTSSGSERKSTAFEDRYAQDQQQSSSQTDNSPLPLTTNSLVDHDTQTDALSSCDESLAPKLDFTTPTLASPSTFMSSATLSTVASSSSSRSSLLTPSSSVNNSPHGNINAPLLPTSTMASDASAILPLSSDQTFPRREPSRQKGIRSLAHTRPSTSPDARPAEFGMTAHRAGSASTSPQLVFLDLQKSCLDQNAPLGKMGSGAMGAMSVSDRELKFKVRALEERLDRELIKRRELELGLKRLQRAGGEQIGRWEDMAGWALSVMETTEREKTLLETDNRRLKREVELLRMQVDVLHADSVRSAAAAATVTPALSPPTKTNDSTVPSKASNQEVKVALPGSLPHSKEASLRSDEETPSKESGRKVRDAGNNRSAMSAPLASFDGDKRGSWDGALP